MPANHPASHYHCNQQYSIIALTNGSGTITERYAYSAYGTPTIADGSGTVLTSSADNNRYTYTGREWDSAMSFYHYRARMYDSVAGRFCSRDPIGYPDGPNGYASYFAIDKMDSLGLSLEGDIARGRCASWLWHYLWGIDYHLSRSQIREWLANAGVKPIFDRAMGEARTAAMESSGTSCEGKSGFFYSHTSTETAFETSVAFVPLCSSIGPLGRTWVTMKSNCKVWVGCHCCLGGGKRRSRSVSCVHNWSARDDFNNPGDDGSPNQKDDIEAYRNCLSACWDRHWSMIDTCRKGCRLKHLKVNPHGKPYFIPMSGHLHSNDFDPGTCSK